MPELRDLPEITKPELRELLETLPERTNADWATIPFPPGYKTATIEISMALPALVQCLGDALRRIGTVELSGLQVSCYNAHLGPGTRSFNGTLGSHWFNTAVQTRADALIAFDNELLGGHAEAELLATLRAGTPDRSCSDRWWQCPSSPRSKCGNSHSVPYPERAQVSAYRSRCPSGRQALRGGCSQTSWTQRAFVPDVQNFAVRIIRTRDGDPALLRDRGRCSIRSRAIKTGLTKEEVRNGR